MVKTGKQKSIHICQACAFESAKWAGQCPSCGEWDTFVETTVAASVGKSGGLQGGISGTSSKPFYLKDIKAEDVLRISSNISEFDRVLGGGFVPGQVILLSGDPGIGKSTILTQVSKTIGKKVVYVCGEESPQQIKIRVDRMGYSAENLLMVAENDVDNIIATLTDLVKSEQVGLIIVDSIQSLTSDNLTGIAGSVGQVRLGAQMLAQLAKRTNVPLILVGHVTKDGTVAGPKVLEHLVDTVLYLEGDSQHLFRVLKTTKNRFGAVSEVGIFEMTDKGLEEVKNPSKMFLSSNVSGVSGSCVTSVMEGHRPLLFEIQALTTKTSFGYPKRTASGFNNNRLQVLIAILEKRCKLNLSEYDVYINVAGGFKVNEYACDLAVCLAIASSIKDRPLKDGTVAFGECGLLGEVRAVSNEANRIKEAKRLGYQNVISPQNAKYILDAIKQSF